MNNSYQKRKHLLVHRSAFLARLSVLLKEGYTFNDALNLLLPHHMKEYETVLVKVDEKFREGCGVPHILSFLGFPSGILLPVVIAEVDGRLADALNGMAMRLKKADEAQKKLKSLLAYPSMLFIFITVLLLAFRKFFLPNMEALAISRSNGDNGFVSALPVIVSKVPDFIFGTGILIGLTSVGCYFVYKKFTPDKKIRVFIVLPIIGSMFSMWKTRTFASEIGSLLQSGLSLQDALDVLISQKVDPVLAKSRKTSKGMSFLANHSTPR